MKGTKLRLGLVMLVGSARLHCHGTYYTCNLRVGDRWSLLCGKSLVQLVVAYIAKCWLWVCSTESCCVAKLWAMIGASHLQTTVRWFGAVVMSQRNSAGGLFLL